MKKIFYTILILLSLISVSCIKQEQRKPKLMVGIVVDQMRHDYLYRYKDRFQEDGFKRLMNDGFEYKNMHFNYIPTKTAPGHASIYSGATPSVHGIIGNEMYIREIKSEMTCVVDERFSTVGSSSDKGQLSPKLLLTTTIADELLLFTQFKSKVLSLSMKNRGAVLPAGHTGKAFWYDKTSGDFITSSYYMDTLPKWVSEFNKRKVADEYIKSNWTPLYDLKTYTASGPDLEPGEMNIDGNMNGFPYDFSTIEMDYELIRNTPFGNDILANFVKSALDNNDLGSDEFTDFLMISYSATDYVGHDSGPYSVEVEDTYLRLDKNIADLLNGLDQKVGKGNYTLFLTSDHAVSSSVQYLKNRNLSAGTFQKKQVIENLKKMLNERFGEGEWLEYSINNQFFLNHDLINEKDLDLNQMSKLVANFLLETDGISEAYTGNEVRQFSLTEREVKGMLARGYNAQRSGDVVYILQPGWLLPYKDDATNHFSGYTYDTHVPMLWFGNGIKKGFSVKYQTITNIAPTISFMLDITLPNGATADPLYELLE
jgi:hypothetical protein